MRITGRGPVAAFAVGLLAAAALPSVSVFGQNDLPGILVSRQLAETAGLRAGDAIALATDAGGARAARFRVAGIYEPTPNPMHFTVKRLEARVHLPDLIALTTDRSDPGSTESVDAVNVRLTDARDAAAFARNLSARVPGLAVRPTTRASDAADPFAVLERFHLAIALVTVIGSTAFLLALMVMTAEERREITGVLRLVGVSQRFILLEVVVEGLLIASAGALAGILIAVAAQGVVNRVFQWRYDTTLVFVRVTAPIALRSVALAVPLGVLAAMAGSWALLRRDVVSLIRR